MKKYVLLVTDSYPPEVRSASHLMQELALEFHQRGHDVTVITTFPEYNLAEHINLETIPACRVESEIKIIRVRTLPIHFVGFLLRGIGVLTLPWFFIRGIRKYIKEPIDRVLVYSPPLPLAAVGKWCAQRYKASYILNVQDLFPQNAIDLGILQNQMLIKFFRWMERRAYGDANRVTVHSLGNQDFLLKSTCIEAEKTSILHNWVDTVPFDAAEDTGVFRKRYGLEGKFVVLFAGVIGPAQGLDILLDIGQRLKDTEEIVFLVVGDGTEKDHLAEQAQLRGLTNLHFHPFVSKNVYPALVKEADVGLVCLSHKMKTPTVPGKFQTYMAAGIPVMGILNTGSDGIAILKDSGAGFAALSGDVDQATEVLRKLYSMSDKERQEIGAKGRKYVEQFFTKEVCISEIEGLFDNIEGSKE